MLVVSVYYLFINDFLADDRFLKRFGPNNFSVLLVCFTPYLFYWLKKRYSPVISVLFLAAILLGQLLDGRRAGFALILAGGFLVHFVGLLRFNAGHMVRLAVILATFLKARRYACGPTRRRQFLTPASAS